jgi:hypothetical protein
MKVPEIRSTATPATQRSQRTSSTSGPRFSDHLNKAEESEGEVGGTSGVVGVSALSALLGAQEVEEDGERASRRKLAERGADILDKLEEIRRDILAGGVPRERLENLAQMLHQRRAHVTDPRLIEIIDEIELRAAVEIAKLTR